MADLSKEKSQEPVPQQAFIGFNLKRNKEYISTHTETHTSKAHQSLSGRNDQIIDNIQRTQGLF